MSIKNFSLGVMFMRKLVPGISIPQCKFIVDEKTGLNISIQKLKVCIDKGDTASQHRIKISMYRKVVSRSMCYYSKNLWGATNRDMSLIKTCFYSHTYSFLV